MAAKTKVTELPFDKQGNMLHYPMIYALGEYRPNEEFHADFLIDTYERGQSAARIILEDCATQARYPMFLSDFVAMTQMNRIKYGEVSGVWIGTKKGMNYGIKMVAE